MSEPAGSAQRLADYQHRYRQLATQLTEIGFIANGTVVQRGTRCGTPGCRCHTEPPRLHGPYYQWTTKVAGKTVTRRLSEREAMLYQQWIANNRQLRELIAQMRQISARAAELILTPDTPTSD